MVDRSKESYYGPERDKLMKASDNFLDIPNNLIASTDIYKLKGFDACLTSVYLQIMIKLFFHHKYYFLKFS